MMLIYRLHISYSDEYDFKSGNTAMRVAELLLENGNKDEIELKIMKVDKEDNKSDTEDLDTDIEGWCRADD